MDGMRGTSPTKASGNQDSPEQLLDSFKAAALSVTKLYKTSALAQTKARSDGYQDCLDDLLAFLDRRNIGLTDGEGWQIRRWATERLEGKDAGSQTAESDDEIERPEVVSQPEIQRSENQSSISQNANQTTETTSPQLTEHAPQLPEPIVVPSQENFTFQSSHSYPQEPPSFPNLALANLALSDPARMDETSSPNSNHASISQQSRSKNARRVPRPKTTNLGKGAGQKRTINIAELFDVGNGKDLFGRDGKRSRHT